ncbi:MAG: hypothetical protein P4M12_05940 [Gammaproteobacteria bacterium]|nr:hypothetical protein [Gammaproteobacteria bacterium]
MLSRNDQESELAELPQAVNDMEEAEEERSMIELGPNPEDDHTEQNALYYRIYQAAIDENEAELKAIQAEGINLEKTRFVDGYDYYTATEKLAEEGHLRSVLLMFKLAVKNNNKLDAIEHAMRGAIQGNQMAVYWHAVKPILLANNPEDMKNGMIDAVIFSKQLKTKDKALTTLSVCPDELYPELLARINYYQENPLPHSEMVDSDSEDENENEEAKVENNPLRKFVCPEMRELILAEDKIRQGMKKYQMTREAFLSWKTEQLSSEVNEALSMSVLSLQSENLPVNDVLPLINSFAFPFSDEKSDFLSKRTNLINDLNVFQTSTLSFFASKNAANLKSRSAKAQSLTELRTILFKSTVNDVFNDRSEESNESGMTELVNQHLSKFR